jgi:hypothetical protein
MSPRLVVVTSAVTRLLAEDSDDLVEAVAEHVVQQVSADACPRGSQTERYIHASDAH